MNKHTVNGAKVLVEGEKHVKRNKRFNDKLSNKRKISVNENEVFDFKVNENWYINPFKNIVNKIPAKIIKRISYLINVAGARRTAHVRQLRKRINKKVTFNINIPNNVIAENNAYRENEPESEPVTPSPGIILNDSVSDKGLVNDEFIKENNLPDIYSEGTTIKRYKRTSRIPLQYTY